MNLPEQSHLSDQSVTMHSPPGPHGLAGHKRSPTRPREDDEKRHVRRNEEMLSQIEVFYASR